MYNYTVCQSPCGRVESDEIERVASVLDTDTTAHALRRGGREGGREEGRKGGREGGREERERGREKERRRRG